MRGLPGSGKSTKARELAAQSGAVIVSRDTIRKQTFGRYTNVDEEAVTRLEDAQVKALLDAGKDVIIDNMNLRPSYLRKWARLATKYGADFDHYDILTEAADCIVNDANIERVREGKHVGHAVILKLDRKYPQSGWPAISAPDAYVPVPYVAPRDKPFALICDIDGTLATIPEGGRSHYDYSRVGEDLLDPCIRDIVQKYASDGVTILITSGREDVCRAETIYWLNENSVPWDALFMRKAGDFRNDVVVKGEIFDAEIRERYQVLFALDDRDRCVKLWRDLGLKCLQVEYGSF